MIQSTAWPPGWSKIAPRVTGDSRIWAIIVQNLKMAEIITANNGRPLIMGILNVTPDSFSDGGDFFNSEDAVAHGLQMAAEGADIIDVGGESTRPGAQRIPAAEQIRRVVPVIERLRSKLPGQIVISVDTTLTEVASAACSAGAGMVNDIAAAEEDAGILQLAADMGLPLILMHKQGTPESMQKNPVYENVVEDVLAYLLGRADTAIRAGVKQENLILDPGFGFGKTLEHNLLLMANLHRFSESGYTAMIGTSRKTFLSRLCGTDDRKSLMGACCATTALGVAAGVRLFRVHDVQANRQAADVAYAMSVRGEG